MVAERGAKAAKAFKIGTRVVSFPMVRSHGGVQLTGLSPFAPGGYAEQVLVEASDDVPGAQRAVDGHRGAHRAHGGGAARRAAQRMAKRDTAIVIGCKPVGLAVICQLKARGVETIVASDFSPGRRSGRPVRCRHRGGPEGGNRPTTRRQAGGS